MQTINPSTSSISSAPHSPEDAKRYTATSSSLRSVNITENTLLTGRKRDSFCRRYLSCCMPRLIDRKRDPVSVATHLRTDIEKQDDVSLQSPARSQKSQEMVSESMSYESNSSIPTKSKEVGFDAESEEIVKGIAAEMSEEMSACIPLPEGWLHRIDYGQSSHPEQTRGLIIDNHGVPRISYLKKIAIHECTLSPKILSYDRALEEKSRVESFEAVAQLNTATMDVLRSLMGEQIFEDFKSCVGELQFPRPGFHPKSKSPRRDNSILEWHIRQMREDN